jgi:hypothetical protein
VYVDVTPLPGPGRAAGPSQGANPAGVSEFGSARAGMFARGEFDLGATPALTVPQQAVAMREGFAYVFRFNPDNRVSQVKVQLGRVAGDRLEVTGGLTREMRIAASGAGFLNDGDLVRVVDANAAANPPAAAASEANRPASRAGTAPAATK